MFGFDDVESVVRAMPDVVKLVKVNNPFLHGPVTDEILLYPAKNERTKHLQKLIDQQRPSRVTRMGGIIPQDIQRSKVVTVRERNTCIEKNQLQNCLSDVLYFM